MVASKRLLLFFMLLSATVCKKILKIFKPSEASRQMNVGESVGLEWYSDQHLKLSSRDFAAKYWLSKFA